MSKMIEEIDNHLSLFDEGELFKYYAFWQTNGLVRFWIIPSDALLEGL